MSSAWCRPSVRDAAPPSLHGVQEGLFPRFLATMKRSDSRPPTSPHFVAFAWRYHPCVLFAPSDPTQGRGPGSWYSGSRAGHVSGDGRVSQVPEPPSCPCALFVYPGRTEDARPSRRVDPAAACVYSRGSCNEYFRGSIARHWDSLSLRSEGHPSPRKTRLRPLAELCRAGFVNPQGRDKRFPCSSHFLLSRAFLTQRHQRSPRGRKVERSAPRADLFRDIQLLTSRDQAHTTVVSIR